MVGYKEYLLYSSGDAMETGRTGSARDSVELWGLLFSTTMAYSFVNGNWVMSACLDTRYLDDSFGLFARDDV